MFDQGWQNFFGEEVTKDYFKELGAHIYDQRKAGVEIYPEEGKIFEAFKKTPHKNVKAVIIGQDPYHEPRQADGMAFSVPDRIKIPPTLNIIFKELSRDLGVPPPSSGDLSSWAEGGILLLNNVLTVERGRAGSHRSLGWQTFTDSVVTYLNGTKRDLVFCLWGNEAQRKALRIDHKRHKVLKTSHPSPLSAHLGFNGCSHFSEINKVCNLW